MEALLAAAGDCALVRFLLISASRVRSALLRSFDVVVLSVSVSSRRLGSSPTCILSLRGIFDGLESCVVVELSFYEHFCSEFGSAPHCGGRSMSWSCRSRCRSVGSEDPHASRA